jgi:aryl-alcohol dehydrogenase-like predicted oxidoreductase
MLNECPVYRGKSYQPSNDTLMNNNGSFIQKIGIGTVQFGLDYGINNDQGKVTENEVNRILNYSIKKGIDTLDTAQAYGDSEIVIGRLLNSNYKYKLVSKATPKTRSIKDDIFKTLNRLKKKNIYGYLIHDTEDFFRKPDLWREMEILKEDKIVQKIGFSLYYTSQLEKLLNLGIKFDLLQIPYNIFDKRFEKYFNYLKGLNVEIHIRSVFLQGLFMITIDRLPLHFEPVKNKLSLLKKLELDYNLSSASLPLWFALSNQSIDRVIIGMNGFSELIDNIKIAEDFQTRKDDYEYINRTFLKHIEETNEEIILPFKWKK